VQARLGQAVALGLLLTACGGADGGAESASESRSGSTGSASQAVADPDGGGGGEIVDAPPPGQATASVDGRDFTFETVGPVGCSVDGDEFTFSFLIGNNEVNLVGGGNASDSTFRFDISITESGGSITQYFADPLQGDSGSLVVDGSSISYSGSMQMLGEGGESTSVGDGSVSATCA
jgi:hypothetical protein